MRRACLLLCHLSVCLFVCLCGTATVLLIAELWQHVGSVGAAAMAEMANYGNVKTDIGTIALVMAWKRFTLTLIVAMGLVIRILSIMILNRSVRKRVCI